MKTERDIAVVAFDRTVAEMSPEAKIAEDKIAAFVRVMRRNVTTGDVPFRRAYLRAMIDAVEVDDGEVRIHGRGTVLDRLVMGGERPRQARPVSFANGAPERMKLGTAM